MSQYRGVVAACLLGFPVAATAVQAPLWEFGAGGAFLDFPHYRGSDQRQIYVLPMPYLLYRGDFLKIERHRLRGLLYQGDAVEFDVSVNGSVPVTNNGARQGMPDLDPTLEIGPSVNIRLYDAPSGKAQLELRTPLRGVIASDLTYTRRVGWLFHPQLNLDMQSPFGQQDWKLGMSIGPLYADRGYSRYFYEIEPAYAQPGRPSYSPDAGYAGTQFTAALTRRFPKYWVSGFLKLDTLRGAAFEDSPLVRTKQFATTGFAVTWIFAESPQKVETDEFD